MKFIEVIDVAEGSTWINVAQIATMFWCSNGSYTVIRFHPLGGKYLAVKETPEEILKKIGEVENA